MSELVISNRDRDVSVEVVPNGEGHLRVFFRDATSGSLRRSPKMTPEEIRKMAALLEKAADAEDRK